MKIMFIEIYDMRSKILKDKVSAMNKEERMGWKKKN